MNLLSDIINYVRRIVKTPNNTVLSDALIIDYINRFYIMDMDARIQLFDYKTRYSFKTTPGVDQYNMPYYGLDFPTQIEPGSTIAPYPVYQNFLPTAYINGVQISLMNSRESFFRVWPNYLQSMNPVAIGNNTSTYSFSLPYQPVLRGHIDPIGEFANLNSPVVPDTVNPAIMPSSIFSAVYISTQDAAGNPVNVQDSGVFFAANQNDGLLTGNIDTTAGWTTSAVNDVNYLTGQVNVTFNANIPAGTPINAQCYSFNFGMPRLILYYNNVLTLRPPPDTSYLVELDAYLSPASFFNTANAIPFGYMAEYIARGAARKLLSDTGDVEQFMFYEPLFKEQEQLVWKRSQRIITSTRTDTIYSGLSGQSPFSNFGQGT